MGGSLKNPAERGHRNIGQGQPYFPAKLKTAKAGLECLALFTRKGGTCTVVFGLRLPSGDGLRDAACSLGLISSFERSRDGEPKGPKAAKAQRCLKALAFVPRGFSRCPGGFFTDVPSPPRQGDGAGEPNALEPERWSPRTRRKKPPPSPDGVRPQTATHERAPADGTDKRYTRWATKERDLRGAHPTQTAYVGRHTPPARAKLAGNEGSAKAWPRHPNRRDGTSRPRGWRAAHARTRGTASIAERARVKTRLRPAGFARLNQRRGPRQQKFRVKVTRLNPTEQETDLGQSLRGSRGGGRRRPRRTGPAPHWARSATRQTANSHAATNKGCERSQLEPQDDGPG